MVSRRLGTALLVVGVLVAGVGALGVAEAGPFAPQPCDPWTLDVVALTDGATADDPVPYESLADYRQERFRAAVDADAGEVPIEQSRWFDGTDSPRTVAYEGTDYRLYVKQNECNVFQELYVMGGALAVLVGTGVGGIGVVLRRRA